MILISPNVLFFFCLFFFCTYNLSFPTPDCTTDDDLCLVIETFGDQYFLESVLASVVL